MPIINCDVKLSIHSQTSTYHWRLEDWKWISNFVPHFPVHLIGSDNGLSSNQYLIQSWNIVDWTLRNKHQWDFNQNAYISIRENSFQNVVCVMASTLSRDQHAQWVNDPLLSNNATFSRQPSLSYKELNLSKLKQHSHLSWIYWIYNQCNSTEHFEKQLLWMWK